MEDTELNKKYKELKQKVLMFEKREAELVARENVLLQENEEAQRKVSKFQTKGKEKNVQGKRKRKEVRSTEEIMERRNLVSTT